MRKNGTIPKLLKLKDNRKKEIELEVKRASDKVDREKMKLKVLEKDLTDSLEFFHEKNIEGPMDVDSVNSYYDFFSRINGRIGEQKKIHDQHKSDLQSLKNNLLDAHKDKKVFEILNEKEIRQDLREQRNCEQKEADFLAMTRRLK